MLDKKECSTILLKKTTITRLKNLGRKTEIYDDIINNLISEYLSKK